jgi:TldD protein
VQPGTSSREEIIADTARGILLEDLLKGTLDLDKKRLRVTCNNAFWIENGRISFPTGRIYLELDAMELLSGIDLVGSDFRYDRGISFCRKMGQTVPIRLGQPTIRIRKVNLL